jgi:UDP-glucose 4-epimerase
VTDWNSGRVLVTGAGGFIGSHVVECLLSAGAPVRALCSYRSDGSKGWLDSTANAGDLEIIRGDVRDAAFVAQCCEGIDVVINLAALIAVPFSYDAPASYFQTNVMGTLNVLESARRGNVSRIVVISTSEVYGTPDRVPIREDASLRAQSPYSASKIAADKLAESFHRSFQTPVVTIRPFNTYGPRQSARAIIPAILTQLISGRREVALGNLSPTRDLTFVSDTVDGIVRAASAGAIEGEVINLGTGRSVSMQELFGMCCKVIGVEASAVPTQERKRGSTTEVMALQCDATKALERLGWRARISLEEGLAVTADWLAKNISSYRPDAHVL